MERLGEADLRLALAMFLARNPDMQAPELSSLHFRHKERVLRWKVSSDHYLVAKARWIGSGRICAFLLMFDDESCKSRDLLAMGIITLPGPALRVVEAERVISQ